MYVAIRRGGEGVKYPQLYIRFWCHLETKFQRTHDFGGKTFQRCQHQPGPVLSSPQNSRWRPKQEVVSVLALLQLFTFAATIVKTQDGCRSARLAWHSADFTLVNDDRVAETDASRRDCRCNCSRDCCSLDFNAVNYDTTIVSRRDGGHSPRWRTYGP